MKTISQHPEKKLKMMVNPDVDG